LDELARRIHPSRTWTDLVLPPGHTRQLRELIDRYHLADRVYGEWQFPAVPSRGLVALFSGPSGTGKTLAAEVIAGELGLDMFKLNLSSVVSKYIGETEKNLDELFEAAGAGNMVLFFDEADALFGRRSEVKDAHDKYANLETSYLLQRLETYDGVVVMATNFEKNIDDAFLRRIHTRVDFAVPGPTERAQIWRNHLEHGAPLDEDVDIDELALRFDLAGGAIRNAAVHAAFLAAAEAGSITQERLVRGMAREYRKLGRLLNKDDFGEHWHTVSTELQRG
jgi:SpoVK/Ycf46/Vps4 family AAA+-type ATPase